jgi:hypothetical protein
LTVSSVRNLNPWGLFLRISKNIQVAVITIRQDARCGIFPQNGFGFAEICRQYTLQGCAFYGTHKGRYGVLSQL